MKVKSASDGTSAALSVERRRELVDEWGRRAGRLDAYARRARRDGDFLEAQDAEQAASEYRTAADDLAGEERLP